MKGRGRNAMKGRDKIDGMQRRGKEEGRKTKSKG